MEDAPFIKSQGGLEDAPFAQEEKPSVARESIRQGAGVARGVADFLGAAPGVVAGSVLGVGDVLTGGDPRHALGAMQHLGESMNPFNLIPGAEEDRKTAGYKYSPGTVAGEAIGKALEGYGKIGELGSELTGFGDPAQIKATTELAMAAGLLGMRGSKPKPGTAAAFRETADLKPTAEQLKASQEARKTYPAEALQDAPFIRTIDPSVAGQMELPMQDPNIRNPYRLPPEEIARLERELNPPTEQRVTGQGELFTSERALTPDELVARRFPLEEPQVGARDRIMTSEAERLQMDTPARVGEMESRVGPPEQAMGGMRDQAALEMITRPGDLGQVGIDRARRQAELANEQPIPYTPVKGPGRRQGGAIHPDLLTFGVSRLLSEQGPRKTIEKFLGTFTQKAIRDALELTQRPKSRETLVWMKPDDFHSLATDRAGYEDISPKLQKKIREGLNTKRGLDEIPWLHVTGEGQVRMHEGRHRMDIFKEKGLDLVPVILISDEVRWGETPRSERPRVLKSQEGALDKDFSIPLPSLLSDQLKQEQILSRHRPMASQTGAINFFQKKTEDSVAKKGVARTFQDMKNMFTFDKRPLKQLIEEERIIPETVTDIADKGIGLGARAEQMLQHALTNTMIDRQVAILSQNKGPIGKIVKWVVDNQNAINQRAKIRIEQAIEVGLGPWKELKRKSESSLRDTLTVWQQAIGKEKLTENSFSHPRQWEVYKALSDQMKDGWERVNKAREKAGLKAIDFIENYFPAIREGDYWIHILDSKGELKWSSAYSSARQAKLAHEALVKEFGKEFEVKEPSIQKKGPYDLSSFSAFEETIRAMSKDDPIKNAIQKRYAEIVGKRGFGKTGIMRKDIGGALGFEAGPKGLKNAEHVLEVYFKRQESYIANLERSQLQKQLAQPEAAKILEKAPIAKDYIDTYLQRARGADLDALPMVRSIVEGLSTNVFGLGRQAPRKFIQNTSSIASLFWLVTPRFLLSQFAQPFNALAKLTDMYQLGKNVSNPAHAFFDGMREALLPDATSLEARAWAQKSGYLKSTIVSLLELKLHDLKGEKWKIVDDAARYSLGTMEAYVVRIPVFHMFEKALRQEIPAAKERFEMAANMMDNYMVHYDRESGALVYDKAGITGEAARPLKTYAHNYWGQFFEYAQTFKDQGRVAPLATLLGTQTLVSGLKGVILVAEATAIITLINTMFNTDIPTPEQLLLESNVSDSLLYGGYSTAIERDISSAMASPSMPQMFSFPPAEFVGGAVKDSWNYLNKFFAGTATDQDEMKAMMAVSPTAMRGWIEALYSEPGKPIPKPGEKMKGDFLAPTDPQEQFIRFGMGLKSIDEAKANAIARVTKQLLARDVEHKLSALDAIADRIQNKEQLDPALLQRYIREGGDVTNLTQNIVARIKERSMTFVQREQIKPVTPTQAHRLEVLKQFLDGETEKKLQEKPSTKDFEKMAFKPLPKGVDREGKVIYKSSNPTDMTLFTELSHQARRMFPGNLERQKQFIQDFKDSMDARRVAPQHFKDMIERRQSQGGYDEM